MSDWVGITDDDLPYPKVADRALAVLRDFGGGLVELSGYRNEEDERKSWTCAAFEIGVEAVAVHVDWEEQSIVVGRRLRNERR